MKLWSSSPSLDSLVERFTVGRDREFDLELARYDVIGSLAHGEMLRDVGLISDDEWSALEGALRAIGEEIERGEFVIEDEYEDVHSKIEAVLTERVGEAGKKIHTARSRNDQVLVDLHLWSKDAVGAVIDAVREVFDALLARSEEHASDPMPGFTHTQIAMPSSFGLFFGAYAELLVDDVAMLNAAMRAADRNPLGSAAGFGSSFPIDRERTTELLGFRTQRFNAVGAGLSRGKLEWIVTSAFASVASTIGRFATDVVLYTSGPFSLLRLSDDLATGSSIMPHKKNPDLFELVRARCAEIRSVPNTIAMMMTNLQGGYHRDYQLLKETLLPSASHLLDVLAIIRHGLDGLSVRTDWQQDERYRYLWTVEDVNRLVSEGVSFRDAYRTVADAIAEGTWERPDGAVYSHTGSIGDVAVERVRGAFEEEIENGR